MKPKTLVLLAVAGGCGLVAMLGVQQAMQGNQQPVRTETAKVLVALENIETGVRLTEDNVAFKERPLASLPEDAVTSQEHFNQRAARVPMMAGDIVRATKLTEKGEFGKSVQIPKGMRVVAINVDDTHTNSGLVKAGDRVDVFVTYQGVNGRGLPTTKTKTLLEYVQVFATDDHTASKLEEKKDISRAKNVSLLLMPEQVPFVLLALRKGSLHLSWRNKGDDEIAQTKDIDERLMEELQGSVGMNDSLALYQRDNPNLNLEEEAPPVPQPQPVANVVPEPLPQPEEPPVPTWTVEVFSGNQSIPHEFEVRDGVATAVRISPNQSAAPPKSGTASITPAPVPPASAGSSAGLDPQAMEEMLRTLGVGKSSTQGLMMTPLIK